MRTSLATLMLVLTTGVASAYCVSVPDDASSGYVRNGVNTAVCLNNELTDTTATKKWQVELNTALGNLDRKFVSDKLETIKPVLPDPLAKPAWP
jgi:hypothetical protein